MEVSCGLSAKFACGLKRKATKSKLPSSSPQKSVAPSTEAKVVQEGWLRKRSEYIKTWKKRYFILRADGSLLVFRTRPDTAGYPDPSDIFTVQFCEVILQENPRRFSLIFRGVQGHKNIERVFSVTLLTERMQWVQAIKLVVGNLDPDGPMRGVAEASGVRGHIRKITFNDFELIRLLGRGTFGKVVLGRERSSKQLYAIKIIKKEILTTKARAAQTMSEGRALRSANHPFLIALKYSFQTDDQLCFVMEYANGGELLFHFARERVFSETKTRFYAAEILLALEYLHERGIVYRDLKLENLLLDREGHIKITDFGLCKEGMTFGKTTKTLCGTPEYLAPEILEGFGYGRAVDWWSFGALLYEIMTGQFPLGSCSDHRVLFHMILYDEVHFPLSLSQDADSLLRGLLTKDPRMRLGGGERDAKDIKEHAFFRDVSWEELLAKQVKPPFSPEIASDTDLRYFDPEFTGQSVNMTPRGVPINPRLEARPPCFEEFSYYGEGGQQGQSCEKIHVVERVEHSEPRLQVERSSVSCGGGGSEE